MDELFRGSLNRFIIGIYLTACILSDIYMTPDDSLINSIKLYHKEGGNKKFALLEGKVNACVVREYFASLPIV